MNNNDLRIDPNETVKQTEDKIAFAADLPQGSVRFITRENCWPSPNTSIREFLAEWNNKPMPEKG